MKKLNKSTSNDTLTDELEAGTGVGLATLLNSAGVSLLVGTVVGGMVLVLERAGFPVLGLTVIGPVLLDPAGAPVWSVTRGVLDPAGASLLV